jgi:hypothetical protein
MRDELTYLRAAYRDVPAPDSAVERAARARLADAMRPRRRFRPTVLLAAALLVGLTGLAAPAVGGRGPLAHVIEFLRGDPPRELVEDLERLDRGAPAGMEQEPIVAKTGKVFEARTDVGVVRIWLTPTKTGRVCKSFEAPDEHGRTRPFSGGCSPAEPSRPIEVGTILNYDVGYLEGRVSAAITRLVLEYTNGGRESVPLQNGFFVATVRAERLPRGADAPSRLIGFDAAGAVVHVEELGGFLGERLAMMSVRRPPVAMISDERELLSVPAGPDAQATLYESPSRIGGTCARLAVDGETWHWDCATPDAPRLALRWSLHRVPSGGDLSVVVTGIAKAGVTVGFVFEDGFVETPPLHGRRFLRVIPPERWQAGRRLEAIVALDEAGEELIRFPMATTGARFYSGPADAKLGVAAPQNVWRPEWPLVVRVALETEHAGEISIEVRRFGDRRWAETLRRGSSVIGGGELQSFPEDEPERPIGVEWVPILSDDGKKDAYIYSGQLRVGVGVRVVYRDGSSEEANVVRPSAKVGSNVGFFLFEITDERRRKGIARLEALDADGTVVARVPAPPVA